MRGVLRLSVLVFAVGFSVDLLAKQWAVSHNVGALLYNDTASQFPLRLLFCAVAIAVALALGRFAGSRGLGRQWGLWIGAPLLVAGVLANGVSSFLWARGVPDFIDVEGGWVWNLADFEIAIGMTGGILSVGVSAVATYARGLRAAAPP